MCAWQGRRRGFDFCAFGQVRLTFVSVGAAVRATVVQALSLPPGVHISWAQVPFVCVIVSVFVVSLYKCLAPV